MEKRLRRRAERLVRPGAALRRGRQFPAVPVKGSYYRIQAGSGNAAYYLRLVTLDYFQKLMKCLGYAEGKTVTYNGALKEALRVSKPINVADKQTQMRYIWNFLRNIWGLSDMHSAAIMGNIKQESEYSPTNAQDNSYPGERNPEYIPRYAIHDDIGWGIVQWSHWSRKQAFSDYAKQKNVSIGDMDVQLEFVRYECNGSEKTAFQKFLRQTSINKATEVFCYDYEGKKGSGARIDLRIEYAKSAYKEFTGRYI